MDSLAPERDALWKRLEAASFLTTDEKRAAAGYDANRSAGSAKYNPYHDELGLFTTPDRAVSSGSNQTDGRVRVAQARGGRGNSPILARFPDATAAQDARWAVSDAWARGAIARAQERIPGYRPQDSVQETIEGEINKNEADARDAEAALAAAGAQARSPPETLDTVCRPNGESIGWKQKGASANIRTVTSDEFDRLTRDLTNGAQEMPPTDPDYQGVWYRRSDGTTIGVRRSERHGLTIDIIDSLGNANLRRLRIHKK